MEDYIGKKLNFNYFALFQSIAVSWWIARYVSWIVGYVIEATKVCLDYGFDILIIKI